MESFDLAVYIGRFQPFHKAHLEIALEALKIADRLLIVIGSRSKGRRTFKNPWNWDERKEMIAQSMVKAGAVMRRVHITSVFDVPDDDDAWREQVQEKIDEVLDEQVMDPFSGDQSVPKVTLVGHEKDNSSYYLRTFPRLVYSPVAVSEENRGRNATDIRNFILNGIPFWTDMVPDGTREFLQGWLRTHRFPKEG